MAKLVSFSVWLSLSCVVAGCALPGEEPEPATSEHADSLTSYPGPPRRPCNRTQGNCVELYVVAHPDDDLLFMNPDILTSIRQGNRVYVIVQDGSLWDPLRVDRTEASQYWIDRERGSLNAYALMARGPSGAFDRYHGTPTGEWRGMIPPAFTQAPDLQISATAAPQFDIVSNYGNVVSLIYLHLGDEWWIPIWGDPTAEAPTRACPNPYDQDLPDGQRSVCMNGSTYHESHLTRQELLDFYTNFIVTNHVTSVSTLDSSNIYIDAFGTQGDRAGYAENENHVFSAMFAISAASKAQALVDYTISVRNYRGYTIFNGDRTYSEKQNLLLHSAEQWDKEDAFAWYAMYDSGALTLAVSGEPEEATVDNMLDGPKLPTPYDYTWNHRYDTGVDATSYIERGLYGDDGYESRKYVSRTVLGTGPLTGRLRNRDGFCLYATSGSSTVTMQPCASTPEWTITQKNQIQLANTSQCLKIALQGDGNYWRDPKMAAETVSLGDCATDRLATTMFLFGNGQIRTPNARCLTSSGSPTSDDCQSFGGGKASVSIVTATSSVSGAPPSNVVDGSPYTVWTSGSGDPQWIKLDLGSVHNNLAGVSINWIRHADQFQIQVSDNGISWTTVRQFTANNPFHNDLPVHYGPDFEFTSHDDDRDYVMPAHGRYVRIYMTHRGSQADYSIAEISVFDHVKQVPPPSQDWTLLFGTLQLVSSQFSDAGTEVESSSTYYKTLGIVNRDVCVRRSNGVQCSEWAGGPIGTPGATLQPAYMVDGGYSDQWGWSSPQYGDTVRGVWFGYGGWPPVACGRGVWGPTCTNGLYTSDFADSGGWTANYYYETMRFIDLYQVGSLNVCGRGYWGISCAGNPGGYSWGTPSLWTSDFSNPAGWSDITNAATIQFGDVNGDGTLDVCGRGDYGMFCSLAQGLSPSFGNGHYWSYDSDRTNAVLTRNDFSDYDSIGTWATAPYYESVRLIDINRDGFADVCGRAALGVYCALSTGTDFEQKRLVDLDLTDGTGWGYSNTGGTLMFGDLDGDARVDMCARGFGGLCCKTTY